MGQTALKVREKLSLTLERGVSALSDGAKQAVPLHINQKLEMTKDSEATQEEVWGKPLSP